ncbi:hypothetical protein F6X40_27820 [Paraburkholderia sp. UCT31]|uniref:hypothetical protein n=1 Tax=Paraburkholderia sp. UCT31 TaxID=2615209 RepID=UPI00165588DB|nr:hypothetical protein [Paraburkholderia sp. UCT31]MBC8740448.1 hypothetical protein [Paraburkholderia sp. UCT31]
MGWKVLKEMFGIKHYVQVTSDGICIGSSYVHNIVTINPRTGEVHENPTFRNFLRDNYPGLLEAKPDDIVKLIETPDTFTTSLAVYTYENGDIIEKQCEEPGWPNVTHDGCMMYRYSFSADKDKVVAWAKRSAARAIEHTSDYLAKAERELAEIRSQLAGYVADQAKLEATYPTIEKAK